MLSHARDLRGTKDLKKNWIKATRDRSGKLSSKKVRGQTQNRELKEGSGDS